MRELNLIYPGATHWQCGTCGTWNTTTKESCKKCIKPRTQTATAYRLENKLTKEEKLYYEQTAPQMIREMRVIQRLLSELITAIKEK